MLNLILLGFGEGSKQDQILIRTLSTFTTFEQCLDLWRQYECCGVMWHSFTYYSLLGMNIVRLWQTNASNLV